jgi:Ni/Fe-hydrogenase subunit HybB-like protein
VALVYLTGAFFSPLRQVHFAIGFAIIPPLLVKLSSTGWRAANYCLRREPYRSGGPPQLIPRLLAPLLVVSAIVATVTGVVLWVLGRQRGGWATLHTDSVVVLAIVLALHTLTYIQRAVRASSRSLAVVESTREERIMLWTLAVALVAAVLAISVEPPWHDLSAP